MLRSFYKNNPLLTKIVLYALGVASIVSVLGAVGQLVFAYQNEKQHIIRMLDDIETNHLDTLVNNIWHLDQEAIEIQLKGILDNPDIIYIELLDDQNDIYALGTRPDPASPVISRKLNLVKHIDSEHEPQELGTIRFMATTDNARSKLLSTTSKMLAAQLITLIITSLIILFLFIQLFNRHIYRIVQYTETLRIGRLDKSLTLSRPEQTGSKRDELEYIVNSINEMRERLRAEMEIQKQTERNLIQEKLFSDTIINSVPGLLLVLNERLQPIRYNTTFHKKFGSPDQDDHSIDLSNRVIDSNRTATRAVMEKVLRTGISASLELSLTSNTGKNIPYLFNISRLILDKTPLLIGIATDISEQKRMEGQLQQAQKMEAIGTLAGGIAHDFNNILSALVGYTQLAQLATQEEKVHNYLTEISKANLRAKDLVAQILSFSRKKAETATQPLQLKPILKEALKLLRSSIPTSIDIHQDIQSDQYVLADATQIHQVLMNLCTNAYHAMKETGGSISVHLLDRQVTAHDYFPDTHIPPGPYVNLEVIDTGTGMDEKTLNKIFEPYFTTKETGVGTGLGLSIVHGIISQYQGHISVYSRLGEGTSFNIYLPVAQPDTTRKAIEVSSENGDDLHGSERILVIDDDPSILKYYDELLTFYGYSVTTCSTGAQALEILKANIDDVDLVITDLAMPGMTGDKLGAEIRSLRKDLPVIISSGFSAPDSKQEFVAQGFVDFFPKPVDSLLLLNRLRKFLIQT